MYHVGPPDPTTGIPQGMGGDHKAGSRMYMQSKLPPPNTDPMLGSDARTRTLQPIVTGTSVLAMKYDGGVILAADTLGSYGSLARYKDIRRLHKVNSTTVLGAGGDISDYQYIQDMLSDVMIEDKAAMDGHQLSPHEIHSLMGRVMYNRRSKFDPLWNSIVIAGFDAGESFLGYVDLVGTTYKDNYVVTGMGAHLALPIIRKAFRPDMTYDEAKEVMETALRVLFYRDCRTINNIQIAKLDASGVEITEPAPLATNWNIAHGAGH